MTTYYYHSCIGERTVKDPYIFACCLRRNVMRLDVCTSCRKSLLDHDPTPPFKCLFASTNFLPSPPPAYAYVMAHLAKDQVLLEKIREGPE